MRCRLYSVQRAELLDGVYKLDSTLQNSSRDQLLTVLLYGSEKYALNVNKEILRLTINYLKASERFVQPLFWPTTFAFIFFYFLMSDCTGLIVSDYIFTRVLCLVSSTVLGFIFHICFVSFIVSDCKDRWYIKWRHETGWCSDIGEIDKCRHTSALHFKVKCWSKVRVNMESGTWQNEILPCWSAKSAQ